MSVGKRIIQLRKSQGITQRQLAKLAKLQQPYVSSIENHIRVPNDHSIHAIADVLGCSVGYLLEGNSNIDLKLDLFHLLDTLSEDDQEHLLSYIRFLTQSSRL